MRGVRRASREPHNERDRGGSRHVASVTRVITDGHARKPKLPRALKDCNSTLVSLCGHALPDDSDRMGPREDPVGASARAAVVDCFGAVASHLRPMPCAITHRECDDRSRCLERDRVRRRLGRLSARARLRDLSRMPHVRRCDARRRRKAARAVEPTRSCGRVSARRANAWSTDERCRTRREARVRWLGRGRQRRREICRGAGCGGVARGGCRRPRCA